LTSFASIAAPAEPQPRLDLNRTVFGAALPGLGLVLWLFETARKRQCCGILQPLQVTIPIGTTPPMARRCISADAGLQQKIPLGALVLSLGRGTAPLPGGCCAE